MTINANYRNGVLTFEDNCPVTSPAHVPCGARITIRKPGTVDGSYTEFEVISVDGEDRLALEIGSKVHNDWLRGAWSPPIGRPIGR